MYSILLMKKKLIEAGLSFTDNIHEAIYILPEGTMVDGGFEMGYRNEDHRCIFSGVAKSYGDYYESSNPAKTHWDRLHKDYRVVRLVPESKIAFVKGRQMLTDKQRELLEGSGYEIERY